MKKEVTIEVEVLRLVSGGVLPEGWESTAISLMALYKGKYGENEKIWL